MILLYATPHVRIPGLWSRSYCFYGGERSTHVRHNTRPRESGAPGRCTIVRPRPLTARGAGGHSIHHPFVWFLNGLNAKTCGTIADQSRTFDIIICVFSSEGLNSFTLMSAVHLHDIKQNPWKRNRTANAKSGSHRARARTLCDARAWCTSPSATPSAPVAPAHVAAGSACSCHCRRSPDPKRCSVCSTVSKTKSTLPR